MSRVTLVPTPIGALHDLTLHAIDVLRDADIIAAEDTRRSATLLAHHGITTPLTRLDTHTMQQRAPRLLEEHAHVAYVSDAGTPGISDPGADLVRLALDGGHTVEVLPGPTAFVPALVLSGLPAARFTFEGFLPRKGSARNARLEAIAHRDHPSAVYEAPQRIVATLHDLAVRCGPDRPASLSRELTKRFETTLRGTLATVAAACADAPPRGECVLIVAGAEAEPNARADNEMDADALAARLGSVGIRGRTLRDALQALGVARNEAYRLAMASPADANDVKEDDAGNEAENDPEGHA